MNNQIFYFFHNLANQSIFFDKIIIFFAVYFPFFIFFGVGVFLFYSSGVYKKENFNKIVIKKLIIDSFVIFGSAFIAFLIATILKEIIQIDRSFVQFDKISPLFNPNQEYSFPSTHATIFSALAFSVFFLHKKAGYLLMFFALLIGLSRIIAGVHFPVDILGGFILGGAVSYLFAYFVKSV